MGIWGLILSTNPMITGPAAGPAEAAIGASQNAALMTLCPLAGVTLQAFDAITRNKGVQHPLFKPANDNAQAGPANDNAPVPYDLDRFSYDQLLAIAGNVLDNLDTDDPQLALQAMQKAGESDLSGGEEYNLLLGRACLAAGDGEGAVHAFSDYLETNPQDPEVVELRMRAYQTYLNSRLEMPGADEEIEELQLAILMDEAYLVNANFGGEIEGIEQLKIKFEDTSFDSPEEALAVLKAFDKTAERYLALGDLPFEDLEAAESNRENMNALAAQTYDAAESVALCSPYEEIRARAPLYAALATLARGDIEDGQKALTALRADFPEAEAIVSEMETHERMAMQLSIVDAWEKHVAQHPDLEEYAEDKALIEEVRRLLTAGEAETVKQAFEKVVEKDNDPMGEGYPTNIGGRAKHILENGHIAGTNGDYIIENFLFYTMQGDISEGGGRALLYQFDQYMSQNPDATAFPAAAFAIIKEMCGDEGIHKGIDGAIKIHSGDGSFGDYAFMAFREIMRGDLPAELGVAAAGSKVFKAVEGFAYARLIAKGWSARKAKVIAFAAGLGVEATTTWALHTAPLLAIKNGEVSGDYLVKSYVANLIGNGSMRLAMGRGEKVAGFVKSPGLKMLITHTFGLGGAVAGNKINQWRGLVPTPKGGFTQSLATDITSYFVFAAGCGIQEKYFPGAVPAKPARAEPVKVEPAKAAPPKPALAAAKQAVKNPAVELAAREPGFVEATLKWEAQNAGPASKRTWTQVTSSGGTVTIRYLQGGKTQQLNLPLLDVNMGKSISTTGNSYALATLPNGTKAISFEPIKGQGSAWEAALLLNHMASVTPAGAMMPRVLGIHMHEGKPRLVLEAFPQRLDQAGIRKWSDLSPAQQASLDSSLQPDIAAGLRDAASLNHGPIESDYLFLGADGQIRMGLPRRLSSFADAVYEGRIFQKKPN